MFELIEVKTDNDEISSRTIRIYSHERPILNE